MVGGGSLAPQTGGRWEVTTHPSEGERATRHYATSRTKIQWSSALAQTTSSSILVHSRTTEFCVNLPSKAREYSVTHTAGVALIPVNWKQSLHLALARSLCTVHDFPKVRASCADSLCRGGRLRRNSLIAVCSADVWNCGLIKQRYQTVELCLLPSCI